MIDLKKLMEKNRTFKQPKPAVDTLFALGLAHNAITTPVLIQKAVGTPVETAPKLTPTPLPPRPPTKTGLG